MLPSPPARCLRSGVAHTYLLSQIQAVEGSPVNGSDASMLDNYRGIAVLGKVFCLVCMRGCLNGVRAKGVGRRDMQGSGMVTAPVIMLLCWSTIWLIELGRSAAPANTRCLRGP
jgi:hypothetical protein